MEKEISRWQNWHNYFSSLTISGKFDEILQPRNFGKFPRKKKTLAHGYLQMCNRNSARLNPVKGVWSIHEQHQTIRKPTPAAIQCEGRRAKHGER